MAGRFRSLRNRTTGELLVLLVGVTVCGYVVCVGTALILLAFFHPNADATAAFRSITSIINTLVGLLAGFLAGRTDVLLKRDKNDEG